MAKLRGEDVIMGFGIEAERGEDVLPQVWIPGRSPSGINPVIDKQLVRETRGTKVTSNASELLMRRAEGDFEFNLRVQSIGYLLLSLFGSCDSDLKVGETVVYEHKFNILLQNPEHPSLTGALSQPNSQDYKYPLAVASNLELTIQPDDLVYGTMSFIAAREVEKSGGAYEPEFNAADVYFRHYDVTVKVAENVAGLGAATALPIKQFGVTLPNNARPDQNVGELSPSNVLALMFELGGSFLLDLENTDSHDLFMTGEYQALQVTMVRSDIQIGSASNPKIQITYPRISIENWSPDRPLDDIVRENIEFAAHYDETTEKAVEVVVTNLIPEYVTAEES